MVLFHNIYPIINVTEITWYFQGSIKFGSNIDKKLEIRCILTYDHYSKSRIRICSKNTAENFKIVSKICLLRCTVTKFTLTIGLS